MEFVVSIFIRTGCTNKEVKKSKPHISWWKYRISLALICKSILSSRIWEDWIVWVWVDDDAFQRESDWFRLAGSRWRKLFTLFYWAEQLTVLNSAKKCWIQLRNAEFN